jgi:hypothetical protein
MWTQFLKHLADVRTPWTIAAFAIAAVLGLASRYGSKPGTAARRGLYFSVGAVMVLAFVPIAASLFSESVDRNSKAMYHLRVTAVDSHNAPLADAVLRSTALSENKTTADGTAEFAIPSVTLPADRKVVVFGEKAAAFLHGRVEVTLGEDRNPAVTLVLQPDDASTMVRGAVQETATGHAIAGASVSVPGFAESATTQANGSFEIASHAASGQTVRLHVEKPGYAAVDQDHIAGSQPAIVQLVLDAPGKRR